MPKWNRWKSSELNGSISLSGARWRYSLEQEWDSAVPSIIGWYLLGTYLGTYLGVPWGYLLG